MKLRKLIKVRDDLYNLYAAAVESGDVELADALDAAWELAANKVEAQLSARRSAV